MMETYRDRLFILRYEDLIGNPQKEVARIAEYLNVSPAGFRTEIIRAIARPMMERLGYL